MLTLLGFARMATNSDDVTPPDFSDIGGKRLLRLVHLGVGHDLDLLALAAEVVEDELGAALSDGVDPAGDGENDVINGFAILQAIVLLNEIMEGDFHVILVWVGMGVWVLFELLNRT